MNKPPRYMRPATEHPGIPKPRGLSDVPRYLWQVISGFFSRLGYIVRLVWETGPWILFCLVFMALFNGFMPVVGSLISSRVLNELQAGFGQSVDRALFLASPIFAMLIVLFGYRILNAVLDRIKAATTRIAGEIGRAHV